MAPEAGGGLSSEKRPTAAVSEQRAKEELRALERTLSPLSIDAARLASPAALNALWDGTLSARALEESLDLQQAVLRKRDEALAASGPGGLVDLMNKSAIAVETPIGQAKMTLIDGQPFVRVAHRSTGLALLMLDEAKIAVDSGHLRRVVARQIVDRGRTPVLVWQRDGRVLSTEAVRRPTPLQARWWKNYWRATYQRPELSDVRLAIPTAMIHGLLTTGLQEAKSLLLGPMPALDFWAPVLFTMGFGLFISVFLQTYKNWVFRGTWLKQLLKAAVISTCFAYPVLLLTQGAGALALLATHLHLAYNVILNNLGGVVWRQIPRMADKHRIYGSQLVLGMKKESVVYQGNYLINWTLRLGDLLHVPGGLAVFLVSIPFGLFMAYLFAVKHGLPEAARMRAAPRSLVKKAAALLKRPRP